jgi:tetratricopeptide (TPR) repeat protein
MNTKADDIIQTKIKNDMIKIWEAKKSHLVVLISFFISFSSSAQTHEIDSLKQLLQKEKTDTGRALRLASLGYSLMNGNPDTAMKLAMEGLALSRKIRFEKGEVRSLIIVGNVYYVLGDYSKALAKYLDVLKIREKNNNLKGQISSMGNLGLVYTELKSYRLSLEYHFKDLQWGEQLGNKKRIANTKVNIASTYKQMGLYDSSILFAEQAKILASKINYDGAEGEALTYLGEISFLKGENGLALEYCRLSFPLLIRAQAINILCMTYLNTASIFEKLNQKDSVLFYSRQSLQLAKERSFLKEVRNAAQFLSYYYRKTNADSAFYYQDISKAMNDSLFSQEKQNDIQSMTFEETMRQQEMEADKFKVEEDRKHNLQYAAIAVVLFTFVIIFFLFSRSVIVGDKFIRFFGILGLLAVFEFINLLIHPHLAHFTNDSPVLMLVILMGIAALLIPLHHKLEHWITHKMIEKNKKIRLASAKRTIEKLEK